MPVTPSNSRGGRRWEVTDSFSPWPKVLQRKCEGDKSEEQNIPEGAERKQCFSQFSQIHCFPPEPWSSTVHQDISRGLILRMQMLQPHLFPCIFPFCSSYLSGLNMLCSFSCCRGNGGKTTNRQKVEENKQNILKRQKRRNHREEYKNGMNGNERAEGGGLSKSWKEQQQ